MTPQSAAPTPTPHTSRASATRRAPINSTDARQLPGGKTPRLQCPGTLSRIGLGRNCPLLSSGLPFDRVSDHRRPAPAKTLAVFFLGVRLLSSLDLATKERA